MERLRIEYSQAKEAWLEQEEQLWRTHEAHRAEHEGEKSLLSQRMEEHEQAREAAECHLREAKTRLDEMEEHGKVF